MRWSPLLCVSCVVVAQEGVRVMVVAEGVPTVRVPMVQQQVVAVAESDVTPCAQLDLCLLRQYSPDAECVAQGSRFRAVTFTASVPSSDSAAWTSVAACSDGPALPDCGNNDWEVSLDFPSPWMAAVHREALWQNVRAAAPGEEPGVSDAWVKIFECPDAAALQQTTPSPTSTSRATPPMPSGIPYISQMPSTVPHLTATGSQPVPSLGACEYPVWESVAYGEGEGVSVAQSSSGLLAVYRSVNVTQPADVPVSASTVWQLEGECVGPPPPRQYSLDEMKSMLAGTEPWIFQKILDPWSAVSTEDAEAAAAVQANTGPILSRQAAAVKPRDIGEITMVEPGRAENPDNVHLAEKVVPQNLFDTLFPVRDRFYTYANFLRAVATFPGVCATQVDTGVDPEQLCRRFLATMFAHWLKQTGAYRADLTYRGASHDASHVNSRADEIYPEGSVLSPINQGLYTLRQVGFDENDSLHPLYCGDAFNITLSSAPFALEFSCAPNKDYFGRGAGQLQGNVKYGMLSRLLFGNERVILDEPYVLAESWLNMASSFWTALVFDGATPPLMATMDGSWTPDAEDERLNLAPGFGVSIRVLNGVEECGFGEEHPSALQRIEAWRYFATQLGVEVSETETEGCKDMQAFTPRSALYNPSFLTVNGAGPWECRVSGVESPWIASTPGDYQHCVDYYYRAHWFKAGELVAEYGKEAGTTHPTHPYFSGI
eukprot:Gregarina_sp_Pseudo_9__5213@NODE_577_length_2556_cov_206_835518_g546_i0_p1_GENE_NODE_577_length_2556_cov_206_835518_g546_i0NODE_577_length_2556_cov_206_835518_g546_i0_p1_ORF_typecomplete_len715_score196_47Glyco_hydro_19/PF00182_19/6_3e10CBM_5_12_2/PF14600_6/0_14CBM_5_12_2/PF14600_6/1_1e04CBM_5_12_2/PF14600_6/7_7e03_NODE_577_length_2556_cov_206_835518_g546_i0812225